MDRRSNAVLFLVLMLALALMAPSLALAKGPGGGGGGGGGGGKPDAEAGNNLSFPVIWAEGVTKVLPGTPGMAPELEGVWWYQWGTNGTDPDVTPASCAPDPDDNAYCDDGLPLSVGPLPGADAADNPLPLAKAYLQKDKLNTWQAGSADWSAAPVNVDWIDWGDNLESLAWTLRSQVRTEVVLFQDLDVPMLEYQMRHTSGWGIDEVHGLAADPGTDTALLGPGTQATVYSYCARLTIQKLAVSRDDPALADLIWVSGEGWTEPEGYETDLINSHLFNGSVHEGGDGPGYYSAEINVKGRIIYGYTWNVRSLNEGAGDYRLTFSFDETCGTASLNTYFVEGTTEIMVPLEEEEVVIEAEPVSTGGVGVLDFDNNLTYIDISIVEKGGGGGKK
jgi:hypothetical protein